MSNAQRVLVKIGTQLSIGVVVAIKHDHVLVQTDEQGVQRFSFTQVEGFLS
jgi:hypothetical protein